MNLSFDFINASSKMIINSKYVLINKLDIDIDI